MTPIKETLLQLFISLMPFVMYNIYYRDNKHNHTKSFILITASLSLLLSMTFAAGVENGIFFDARYILMYFSIMFGGIAVGSVIFAEFIIYRLLLGGDGTFVAILIVAFTFPLSVLFYKLFQQAKRLSLITFFAGIVISSVPFLISYLYFDPDYFIKHLGFHILVLPIQNSIGIWLLISLFSKSVSDKKIYVSYLENEKVNTISHVAASLAHEVRNPLTVVKGFLTLIRERPAPDEKVAHYIDISISEIQRTESILSEFLSISKPLSGGLERTNLSELLHIMMEVMSSYANMNNVGLEVSRSDYPVWIMANPDEIKQTLLNFIKNAVEACSAVSNGKVALRLDTNIQDALLFIEDNGIGMKQEQVNRLGSIYFTTKSSGTGLGLTFSYQVIRTLGGTISVHSEPGEGTQFTITLPLLSE
ncbi:ATP-binding protein [Paenibacillus oceani]|uniref:histidine kinase n=1 Tax=Paenibacillus oceani TaxID=2772510 RepID=A0A927CDH5_9BACL|nr:HAMP domain-containing sensor histidine kinase [Paenibacillus oceani]MBD2865620.1 HAMP domain-containing histidine kinase [Paenibacillus oceani]